MDVVGEVHCLLSQGKRTFTLDALVVNKLDVEVLAGIPFIALNDVATNPVNIRLLSEVL